MNFAKFFKTPFSQSISGGLPLDNKGMHIELNLRKTKWSLLNETIHHCNQMSIFFLPYQEQFGYTKTKIRQIHVLETSTQKIQTPVY